MDHALAVFLVGAKPRLLSLHVLLSLDAGDQLGRNGLRELENLFGEAGMRFSCPIFGTPRHTRYMLLHALTCPYMHLQHTEKWLKARKTRILSGFSKQRF